MSGLPNPPRNKMPFDAIAEKLRHVYSAVLCDVLDSLGFRQQALSYRIRPLFSEALLIGRARTLISQPVDRFPEKPYAKELEALDTLQPDDVIVFDTGEDLNSAVWGEL